MSTGKELVAQAQKTMESMAAEDVHQALQSGNAPVILDVREREEWNEGHIAQALHVARGRIEGRAEQLIPDRSTPIVCH